MKMRKLAVLSHILPPSPSGQAMMLHRILRSLSPADYCLISREDYSKSPSESSPLRLPAPYYHLGTAIQLKRPSGKSLYRVRDFANLVSHVIHRTRALVRIVQAEECSAIMACSGDIADIPAGYLTSRWLRLPFYAYLFDDYLYQWTRPLDRIFARWVERFAMRNAGAVIVPNEFLRDEYRLRYGVEPIVIHNPCEDIETYDTSGTSFAGKTEIKIVFTGAIYHANYGAFRNLLAALKQLGRPDVRLHLYTFQNSELLKKEHIAGPVVYHDYLSPQNVQKVQQRADILFLPLSFDSGIPEVIKTSAPGKMGEYLATGRPVLAHTPPDSFVTSYFREYDCGLVVEEENPTALACAIQQLLNDSNLRSRIVANARERANVDFRVTVAQQKFAKLLSGEKDGA